MILSLEPLCLSSLTKEVAGPVRGAVVTFSGNVRDSEDGKKISAIHYEAFEPMAESALSAIVEAARMRWGVKVLIRHRLGRVPVGESSLLVACAGVHRRETFDTCSYVVEEIKKMAPIWKVSFETE